MFIVRNKKIFFALSLVFVLGSLTAWVFVRPAFGTDFVGGSILEVRYENVRPSLSEARLRFSTLPIGNFSLRPSGGNNFVLRARELTPEEKTKAIEALSLEGAKKLFEERFSSVGPVVGENLKRKSIIAITVVIVGIVLFITFAFRKISRPVPSWKYGLATIIALAHDVAVPAGAYAIYAKATGAEIDLLFVTALLAILGYSVHDTIVVFDRVRENLRVSEEERRHEEFSDTVGRSVAQTFTRSINTSLTIFLVLVALYFIGSESTSAFAFTLLVGIVAGTYSSIFLASPLLVLFERIQKKR
ncbi:protein translocase subunit SecF [Patescibacteria group bacterium]|nr:MAG: protein translocase subunit SecF [Patescibacteria group bacterium]